MTYLDRYKFWCNAGLPEDVMAELKSVAEDEEELKGRFGGDLQFGTAGMRGIMGAGSNRLNRYTVRRAAQGMAAWLSGTDLPQKAAIGYDSRHNSQLFSDCHQENRKENDCRRYAEGVDKNIKIQLRRQRYHPCNRQSPLHICHSLTGSFTAAPVYFIHFMYR